MEEVLGGSYYNYLSYYHYETEEYVNQREKLTQCNTFI